MLYSSWRRVLWNCPSESREKSLEAFLLGVDDLASMPCYFAIFVKPQIRNTCKKAHLCEMRNSIKKGKWSKAIEWKKKEWEVYTSNLRSINVQTITTLTIFRQPCYTFSYWSPQWGPISILKVIVIMLTKTRMKMFSTYKLYFQEAQHNFFWNRFSTLRRSTLLYNTHIRFILFLQAFNTHIWV